MLYLCKLRGTCVRGLIMSMLYSVSITAMAPSSASCDANWGKCTSGSTSTVFWQRILPESITLSLSVMMETPVSLSPYISFGRRRATFMSAC